MNKETRELAELLAALHAAGAASTEDEKQLQQMLLEDPSLQLVITEFEESIATLASSYTPLKTSPHTLRKIRKKIARERIGERRGFLNRLRDWLGR